MNQALPTSDHDLSWLMEEELETLDIEDVDDNSEEGFNGLPAAWSPQRLSFGTRRNGDKTRKVFPLYILNN